MKQTDLLVFCKYMRKGPRNYNHILNCICNTGKKCIANSSALDCTSTFDDSDTVWFLLTDCRKVWGYFGWKDMCMLYPHYVICNPKCNIM